MLNLSKYNCFFRQRFLNFSASRDSDAIITYFKIFGGLFENVKTKKIMSPFPTICMVRDGKFTAHFIKSINAFRAFKITGR